MAFYHNNSDSEENWCPELDLQRIIARIEGGVFRGQGLKEKKWIEVIAPFIGPEDIANIINKVVIAQDLETLKWCLEKYTITTQVDLMESVEQIIKNSDIPGELSDLILSYTNNYSWSTAIHTCIIHKRVDILEKLAALKLCVRKGLELLILNTVITEINNDEKRKYISLLMQTGVTLSCDFDAKCSMLTAAIKNFDHEAVKILLDMGAEMCIEDLEWACFTNTPALELLAEQLKKTGRSITSMPRLLPLAVGSLNPTESTKCLLKAGMPADSCDEKVPIYAIEVAVQTGKSEALKILLDAGASVRIPTIHNHNLLFVAIEYHNPECLRLLLDNGQLDVNEIGQDVDEFEPIATTLSLAVEEANVEIIQMLIEYGAKLYPQGQPFRYIYPLRDSEQITPLLPLLAQETIEGRFVNKEDIRVLKKYFPSKYSLYEEACQEWRRMQTTPVIADISHAQVIERPARSLLRRAEAPVPSRHVEFYRLKKRFPIHNKAISRSLKKFLNLRASWIANHKKLIWMANDRLPEPIREIIINHIIE